MHWKETKVYLWVITGVLVFISFIMAWLGAWMVLPFAGLEVIVLASLMYWVAHQCRRQQVISFKHNRVHIEKGHVSPSVSWESELFFTRLMVDPPAYRGHLCKVFLRSKDQKLEVGEFLNEEDKKRLIAELRRVISAEK